MTPIAFIPDKPHTHKTKHSMRNQYFEFNVSITALAKLLHEHFQLYPNQRKPHCHISQLFTQDTPILSMTSILADDIYDFFERILTTQFNKVCIGHSNNTKITLSPVQFLDWMCREVQIPKEAIQENYALSNATTSELLDNLTNKLNNNMINLYTLLPYFSYRLNINMHFIIIFARTKKFYQKLSSKYTQTAFYENRTRYATSLYTDNGLQNPPLTAILLNNFYSQNYPQKTQRMPTLSTDFSTIIFAETSTLQTLFHYNDERNIREAVI